MPLTTFIASVFCTLVLFAANVRGQAVLDSFDPNVNGTVRAIAVQPDGKIIIGGDFTSVGGSNYASLARLHRDGTVDASFTNRAVTNVLSLALQADGKILVGATWSMMRVNNDGTRDTTYGPPNGVINGTTNIAAIIVQPDGKALAARVGATIRLNTNGTIDSSFSGTVGHPVMALQPDGQIVFRNNAWGEGSLRRMNSTGALDTNYSVAAWYAGAAHWTYISQLLIQPDGKLLVGGYYDWLNGPKSSLARLNPDGTLDPTFTLSAYGSFIDAIARQSNGKVVFISNAYSIRRCSSTGLIETNFNFTASGGNYERVQRIVAEPDGNFLVVGDFTSMNGLPRNGLARIISNDLAPSAPPQFTRFSKHPGNVIRFNATNLGETNLSAISVVYSPDAATSLEQWSPVASSVSLVGGAFQFTDPGLATNPPVRFYRLAYQP
jgi:uncharacterized delta-60 repeat protein